LGPRIAAETLRRFWTMLAHGQGGLLNASNLARGLGVDGKTVASYLDLLVDLLLVRRLPPWHRNVGKRLVKSPKVYVRDSGVVHALLGLAGK
jgi:predicted AAA+ superfamily ATPase